MKHRLQQIDESIEQYLGQFAIADHHEPSTSSENVEHLEDKIAALKKMACLKKFEFWMLETRDQQISLTDLDVRSMAASGRGMVDYNV